MKKFIAFAVIILYFTLVCIFLAEKTDIMNLENFPWHVQFEKNNLILWQRLPYPSYYEIDIFTKNPDNPAVKTPFHLIKRDFSFTNKYELPPTIYPTYYRVRAHGLFGIISDSSFVGDPVFTGSPLIPTPITNYTSDSPASIRPYLIWHTVPDAVYYELELLSGPPDDPDGIELSQVNHLFSSRSIFTHGYQADLSPYLYNPHIFWRVRGLDARGNPIGIFSEIQQIHIDKSLTPPSKPLPDSYDTLPDSPVPLYPVYHWLPMYNASRYEVELLDHPPLRENDTSASLDRLESIVVDNLFSAYDPKPMIKSGTYYWRVRAIDQADQPIGTWSDSQKITVSSVAERTRDVAVFGDSISHGGGNISYSPANLEYNYQTYLDFPTVNLAKSGDTSRMSLERFDKDVLIFAPRNLLIMAGTNSLRDSSISAQMIINDLQAIFAKCKKNNIRPIFLTLTPLNAANIETVFNVDTDPAWKEKMTQVNDYIRTLPYYIDLEPYFYDENGNLSEKYSPDGLHPDLIGKQLMAAIINQHKELFILPDGK
ncbi:GDSL-type esterase/lipase family protein [Pectinatus haikarae]|uniref:GDSL-type esterase/lipase family protein n=1 Tax=Pectinatus haikarae TaxID=349096 RepID=UPI0018C77B13|nr:GDSL-type esterase/lipase family protein [Pectinatus haikarae]